MKDMMKQRSDCPSCSDHLPARNLSTRYLVYANLASLVRHPNSTIMYFSFDRVS